MTPLGLLVAGQVLVVVDLSLDGIDLVPDVVGWTLALFGLGRLAGRSGAIQLAVAAGALGMVVAVLELVGATGSLLALLSAVSQTAVVFFACTAIMAMVEDAGVQRTANLIRWWDLGLVLLAFAAVGIVGEDLGAIAIVLIVPVLVVAIWFLVFCWQQRSRPELSTARDAAG